MITGIFSLVYYPREYGQENMAVALFQRGPHLAADAVRSYPVPYSFLLTAKIYLQSYHTRDQGLTFSHETLLLSTLQDLKCQQTTYDSPLWVIHAVWIQESQ